MKTHRFDALSFITGLLIMATGLLFLFVDEPSDMFDLLLSLGGWFWPVLLMAIGLAVLIPLTMPKSKPDDQTSEGRSTLTND
jgi:hypothetical protein